MKQSIRYIITFLLFVFVQVLLLNNIHLFDTQAYLYILFLILLPATISSKQFLLIGFFTGLLIDIFTGTYGVHTAATTFVAFIRPFLLRSLLTQNLAEVESLSFSKYKMHFVGYVVSMVVLHHFTLLLIDSFSFQYVGVVLLKTFISSIFTLILIFCILLFKKN